MRSGPRASVLDFAWIRAVTGFCGCGEWLTGVDFEKSRGALPGAIKCQG